MGGREDVAIGLEVLEGGDCDGPGSGGESISGLDGDEGSVEGFRKLGRGESASGEGKGDVGVDESIGLLEVVDSRCQW